MSVSSTYPHEYIQRHPSAHTEREIYSLMLDLGLNHIRIPSLWEELPIR